VQTEPVLSVVLSLSPSGSRCLIPSSDVVICAKNARHPIKLTFMTIDIRAYLSDSNLVIFLIRQSARVADVTQRRDQL
jgi:phosphoribosyl-dephospho-CoA transferase